MLCIAHESAQQMAHCRYYCDDGMHSKYGYASLEIDACLQYYAEEWVKQGHLRSDDQSQRRKTNLILSSKNKQDDNTLEEDFSNSDFDEIMDAASASTESEEGPSPRKQQKFDLEAVDDIPENNQDTEESNEDDFEFM